MIQVEAYRLDVGAIWVHGSDVGPLSRTVFAFYQRYGWGVWSYGSILLGIQDGWWRAGRNRACPQLASAFSMAT